jgi:phospholipid-binding lipoprotein MlaA
VPVRSFLIVLLLAAAFTPDRATAAADPTRVATAIPSLGDVADPAGLGDPVDPLESFNRNVFRFNQDLDGWVLEPIAEGWNFVAPRPVQRAIDNFFDNLLFPIRFANLLLQGNLDPAALTLSRFCVNTTLGLGGLFDVANELDLKRHQADFGQTLGIWGVPPGPYLVLPVWGPSNPRDAAGLFIDGYLGAATFFLDWPVLLGSVVAQNLNRRTLALKDVENLKEASLDLYVAVRDAYGQLRTERVFGAEAAQLERAEDLYFFDEEEW